MDVVIEVVPDARAAAIAAGELLARVAAAGGDLALPGGATPRPAYEHAAALGADWSRAGVWLGDDRCVPPDDPLSNFRLVREALVDRLADTRPSLHRIPTELGPDDAAAAYDRELRGVRLELVLLGLGSDGHTASLFPHAPALDERERLVVAADAGLEPFVPRVTLTLPAIALATEVVFLVVGAEKAEQAWRAFRDDPSPATPASLVRAARATTRVIIDEAAATLL